MIKTFYNVWSINIRKDAVRVIPINLSEEQRELRNMYYLKLSGFPYRFPTSVLMNLLKEFNVKAIFVPRRPHSYINMNYAFAYFLNDDDMQVVIAVTPASPGPPPRPRWAGEARLPLPAPRSPRG